MGKQISRRSALAAIGSTAAAAASVTVAALPDAATALQPREAAALVDHPDRELLELGAEYDRLVRTEEAAADRADDCWDDYESQLPPQSDILRHRVEDLWLRLPVGPSTKSISADPKRGDFYTADEVAALRFVPPAFDLDALAQQRRRVAEITEEFGNWIAECDALRERSGYTAAAASVEDVLSAQRGVVSRIAAARATTIAGLQVRARILAEFMVEEETAVAWDRMMIAAIVRDLAAMSETST